MNPVEIESLITSALKQAPSQEHNLPLKFTDEEEAIVKEWQRKYQEAMDKLGTDRGATRKINGKPAFRLGSYKFGK